ncbi:hypothetical protein E4U19_007073 [Claviceps sp. Clav32 group G5]|nr:hypothetical protein E4U19_007073 [Claviceps sp. Clav32 group G5]
MALSGQGKISLPAQKEAGNEDDRHGSIELGAENPCCMHLRVRLWSATRKQANTEHAEISRGAWERRSKNRGSQMCRDKHPGIRSVMRRGAGPWPMGIRLFNLHRRRSNCFLSDAISRPQHVVPSALAPEWCVDKRRRRRFCDYAGHLLAERDQRR